MAVKGSSQVPSNQLKNTVGRSILSDNDIRRLWGREIIIRSPGQELVKFDESQIQLGSIDLHFQRDYKKIKLGKDEVLTYDMLVSHRYTKSYSLEGNAPLRIEPGEMILTNTLESVQLDRSIAGFVYGRNSIARLGIEVTMAPYINPGHGTRIPLQLVNRAPCTVELAQHIAICQLVLLGLNSPASNTYKKQPTSKYATETTVKESQIDVELDVILHNEEQEGK